MEAKFAKRCYLQSCRQLAPDDLNPGGDAFGMALYFFHVCHESGLVPDEEGTECVNLDAALEEARASARDLAKQFIDERVPLAKSRIEILDETGCVVAFVPLNEVLSKPH